MDKLVSLRDKYHVAAPRYTSYPTVPFWDEHSFSKEGWLQTVRNTFQLKGTASEGISIYIHLPFCESLCTYCGCNTRITKNHQVEIPYLQAVLKEYELYLQVLEEKPVIREIHLGGGTPTFFSAENLSLLINGILLRSAVHAQAEFSFEAHPGNTTEAHLLVLYALGFRRISLGIQDFDPAVQLMINRIQTEQEVADITEMARAIGYTSVNYDLIYGLPVQHLKGLEETIHAVLRLKPDRIAFYSYAHVPWVKPGQRRYTEEHLPDLVLKQQLYEMGRALLKSGGYLEIGMDHFTLKTDSLYVAGVEGNLHRNFMGYTHQSSALLIGLGVSSISDSWTGFAQNVKKVEDYLELLDRGEIPVVKGHLLDSEDLLIRKHILALMCQGRTSFSALELKHDAIQQGLERMQVLIADALVVWDGEMLEVTSTGKSFLRNICMALDTRLWAAKPQTQLFSMAD